MIHEFRERIYVDTPLGRGRALFVETGNEEHYWTVEISESHALVTFRQHLVRIRANYSDGGISDEKMRDIIR